MLITTALLAVLASAPAAEPNVSFQQVETLIHQQRWAKAERRLHKDLRAVITAGGEMDGGDLMHAVRLRALIEAGAGRQEAAEWWWHAGLNLRSEGAESVLDLVPEEAANPLRHIRVRPSRPPEPRKLPKFKNQPKEISSALYNLANAKLRGTVSLEVQLGDGGELLQPLITAAGVPAVGIYAALDKIAGTRFPMEMRRLMGDTHNVHVLFRGSAR